MEIAHIIADIRSKNKLSQRDLADKIGVSSGVVGSWETGRILPGFESCIALADYFRISTDVLFEKDRKLSPDEYKPLAMPQDFKKMMTIFTELSEENRDILIGKGREILKEQRLEEKSIVDHQQTRSAQ